MERDADDVVEIAIIEVGRDLDEQGPARRARVARFDGAGDEHIEGFLPLQFAQSGRVGRRHVDREIVRNGRERPDAGA